MGIPNIKTTEAPYLIFGKTLQNLPNTHWDAALGLSAVVFLYTVRYSTQKLARTYPKYAKYLNFLNISRNIIVIVLATFLSFLINHFGHFETSPFKILGQVPAGFQNMGVPHLDSSLLSLILPNMVGVVVLQVMEHCSIATSLGKMADYKSKCSSSRMRRDWGMKLTLSFCFSSSESRNRLNWYLQYLWCFL
jgi:sodium-independent sulfate anion transporter 11